MKGPLGELMQQAQKMQENMQKMQEELANMVVTGESGAGLVKVEMNGRHDVSKVSIDPEILTEEKSMIEDLVAAAINDAVRKIEANNKDKMSDITGGMQLPPGFKLPF